jgi:hypothetical protein
LPHCPVVATIQPVEDDPDLEWSLRAQLLQWLMRMDAKLDLLIELLSEDDGEEEETDG